MARLNKDFTYTQSSIADGDTDTYDFINGSNLVTQSNTDDYAPFENVTIYNNGVVDLRVFINSNQADTYKILPKGVILSLESVKPISIVFVENASGGGTAGSYQLNVNNDVSQLSLLKRIGGVN